VIDRLFASMVIAGGGRTVADRAKRVHSHLVAAGLTYEDYIPDELWERIVVKSLDVACSYHNLRSVTDTMACLDLLERVPGGVRVLTQNGTGATPPRSSRGVFSADRSASPVPPAASTA